jgi:hypothetical protein
MNPDKEKISFKTKSDPPTTVFDLMQIFGATRDRFCSVPRELTGKVVSGFDELKKNLPSDELYNELYLRAHIDSRFGSGYDIYSRHYKFDQPLKSFSGPYDVAVGCPKCEHITIGPPEINTQGEYLCRNCLAQLSGEINPKHKL